MDELGGWATDLDGLNGLKRIFSLGRVRDFVADLLCF